MISVSVLQGSKFLTLTSMENEYLPVKLIEEPNVHLKCPVCSRLYSDPVINVRCGHTFCRKCVFVSTKCPLDNMHCDTSQLVINRLVIDQMDDLLIHCRYGLMNRDKEWVVDPAGCKEAVKLGKRHEHEKNCGFAKLSCPNSRLCGSIRRKSLDRHIKECQFVPGASKDQVCKVKNASAVVQEHSKIFALEEENKTLRHQITDLTGRVSNLEEARDDMLSQLTNCTRHLQSLQLKYDELHGSLLSHNKRWSSSQWSLSESAGIPRGHPIQTGRGNSDNFIKMERWEMPLTFKCIGTCRGHQGVVWCLCVYKGKLYSSGEDSLIKVWDLESLAKGCVNNFRGHTGMVHCLAVFSNSLYSAGDDHTIRVWDLATGAQVQEIENAHEKLISAMVVYDKCICTSSFSIIKVWDTKSLALRHTLSPNMNHWIRALALSMDKQKLFSGSHDAVNIWETENFTCIGIIEHTFGSVYSLAVTNLYIITGSSGSYNKYIHVFDATTFQHITSLKGHLGTVTALTVSPSGNFLFSGSQDSHVQIWGMERLLPIQTLQRHQASVNALALFGDLLLSGSADHEIKVFRYFQLQ